MRGMWLLKLEIRTLCILVLVVSSATACSSHKDSGESGQSDEDGGPKAGKSGSDRAGAGGRTGAGGRNATGEAGKKGDDGDKPGDGDGEGGKGPKAGSSAAGSKAPDIKDAGADDEDAGPIAPP